MRPLPKLANRDEAPVCNSVEKLDTDSSAPPRGNASDQARVLSKSRWKRGTVVAGLIAALLLAAYIYITIGLSGIRSYETQRMTLAQARPAPMTEAIPINASVIPENSVFLDTVEGGRVATLHVDDGTEVEVGDPLVTLKNMDIELDVIAREAQYTQQLSNLAQSEIAFDQSQMRYDRDLMDASFEIERIRTALDRRLPVEATGVAQSEIDTLRAELAHNEAAHALIARAKARDSVNATRNLQQLRRSVSRMEDSVALMQDSLEQLTLRAPIAGRLSSFTLQPGQVLAPGARIGQVDQTGSFKLRAPVNEFYLGRLSVGQSATATVNGQPMSLTVTKIYPTIADRQFEIDLEFAGSPPDGLRRGQTIRVRLVMGEAEQTLTIPAGPFESQTGGQWVYVVAADGRSAARRDIALGRRSPDRLEVLSGLSDGETIITSNYEPFGGQDRIDLSDRAVQNDQKGT